jgi:hypothetical protein
VCRIGGARGDERRHRSCLGNAFLEDLPVLRFLVVQQRVHVDRLVLLPDVRVDADRAEERLHAERPRFVGNDRDDEAPDFLVAQQFRQNAHEDHRRGRLAPLRAFVELFPE